MNLSNTLRSPLDQYVDDYFGSKVKDLATAFNLSESEILHVLEFGCREIKRAPSRRSSSRESEPEKKPASSEKKPATPVEKKPAPRESEPEKKPATPVEKKPASSEKKPAVPTEKSIEKCAHSIKGVNPRVCGKGANYSCDEKWYCKPHLKIYTKKVQPRKVQPRKEPEEKSIAKKIWKKKTLEKKFNFVEEDGYYFDSHTRICISPNSKEAFGILPKDGGPIQPLQDEHLELLTAANFKYREVETQLDELISESDGEELVLLLSDVESD